jgi:predicted P-loop ATPase
MSAQNQNSVTLRPDRGELVRFITALFCRADPDSFVSLRAFYDHKEGFALYEDWQTVRVTGNDEDIVDAAEDLARLAAEDDEAIVFAPPICTFSNRDKADEGSVPNGLTISVELDANPAEGKRRLEAALGPMTLVIESGGLWIDAATGQVIPKLHLHLRLAVPTRSRIEHDFLKEANKLAAILAGGDPTGVPLVHPLRWAGSVHRKAEPRLARIIEYNPEVEITLAEALDKLRAAVKKLGPGPGKGNGLDHSPPTDMLDLCAALAVIPNDDSDIPKGASWKQWTDMGLRIWAATSGSEAGLVLFIDWSRRSKKFDEAATRERWKHYTKYPPDRTNAGAIFNRAREIWPDFVRPSELARRARLDASLNEFEGRQPPPAEGNDDPSVGTSEGGDNDGKGGGGDGGGTALPSSEPEGDDGVAHADDEDDARYRRQCPPVVGREATFKRKPDWQHDLLLTARGGFRPCFANAVIALRHAPEWDDRIWFDAFHNRPVLRGVPPWSNKSFADEPWSDLFTNLATNWMQHQGLIVSQEIVGSAAWTVAHDQWFHPVRQYLEGCRRDWDGTKRIEIWTTTYLGTPNTPYSRAVGQRWLISPIARVMEPGCKADCSLVLEGPQGMLKSELLRRLGYPWVTDDMGGSDPGSKDAAIQIAGVWILELPELEQFTDSRDRHVTRTKSFMSRSTDRFRPPYGRTPVLQPRQCVFGCTTNKREYLPDETGNRRWWPIVCTRIDLDLVARDRDQLFGEAVALYERGEPWWLDTPELNRLATAEQEDRYVADAWGEKIADYVATVSSVSVAEILANVINLKEPALWGQSEQNRVVRCLRSLGWEQDRVTLNGKRQRRYYRPEPEDDEENQDDD